MDEFFKYSLLSYNCPIILAEKFSIDLAGKSSFSCSLDLLVLWTSSSYIYLHIHLDTEIIISSSRVFMCYNSINLYSRCVASFATFNIIDKIFISFTLYPWGFGLNTLCPWVFSLFTLCLWDYEMLIEHRIFSL